MDINILHKNEITICSKHDINCVPKISLIFVLSSVSELLKFDNIYFDLIWTKTQNNTPFIVEQPYKIRFQISHASIIYQLKDTGNMVNEFVKENIIQLGSISTLNPSKSCLYPYKNLSYYCSNPSKYFCCWCTTKDKFMSDFYGEQQYSRGDLTCGSFKNNVASLHCLIESQNKYKIYDFVDFVYNYTVNITILQNGINPNNNIYSKQIYSTSLNPIILLSHHKNIKAQILGTMMPLFQMNKFSTKFLLAPQKYPFSNIDNLLVVDKSDVDITGEQCDKIGSSHKSFMKQSLPGNMYGCRQQKLFCLNYSIQHLLENDKIRTLNHKPTKNIITSFGDVYHVESNRISFWASNPLSILLSVEIPIGNITLKSYRVEGQIESIFLEHNPNPSFGNPLIILVKNIGNIPSIFYLVITGCDMYLKGYSNTKKLIIMPNSSEPQEIHFFFKNSTTINKIIICNIVLEDSYANKLTNSQQSLQLYDLCPCFNKCPCHCVNNEHKCSTITDKHSQPYYILSTNYKHINDSINSISSQALSNFITDLIKNVVKLKILWSILLSIAFILLSYIRYRRYNQN